MLSRVHDVSAKAQCQADLLSAVVEEERAMEAPIVVSLLPTTTHLKHP